MSQPEITRRTVIGAAATLFVTPRPGVATAPEPVTGDIVFGRPDSAVRLVAYLSASCPHCARFVRDALPVLIAGPVAQGAMAFVWRDAYLAAADLHAVTAMRAAGVAAFPAQAARVFGGQAAWCDSDDPAAALRGLAGEAEGAVAAALTDSTLMRALLDEFRRTGGRDGICASPTFLAGERRHTGYLPAETLAVFADAAQSTRRGVPSISAASA